MLRTYLYVPQKLNEEINAVAEIQKISKAELMRNALKEGLVFLKRKQASSASVLLRIAEIGGKYKPRGPRNLSAKMDDYLWKKNKSKIWRNHFW